MFGGRFFQGLSLFGEEFKARGAKRSLVKIRSQEVPQHGETLAQAMVFDDVAGLVTIGKAQLLFAFDQNLADMDAFKAVRGTHMLAQHQGHEALIPHALLKRG